METRLEGLTTLCLLAGSAVLCLQNKQLCNMRVKLCGLKLTRPKLPDRGAVRCGLKALLVDCASDDIA